MKKLWNWIFPKKESGEKITFDIDRKNFSIGTIFLGVILGIFLLSQTEQALFEVGDFFDKPNCPLNRCSELNIENIDKWFFQDQNQSVYTKRYGNFEEISIFEQYPNLKTVFEAAAEDFAPVAQIREKIQSLEREKKDLENMNTENRENYNSGLLEDIANSEKPIFQTEETRQQIADSKEELKVLNNRIAAQTRLEKDLFKIYEKTFANLKNAHANALKEYETLNRIFKLKVFGIQFLLTFPLLMLGNLWYRRSKEKNSKYAILPLLLMIVGGITFLQILMMYASSWIPFEFFGKLFKWIAELPFGRIIVHYVFVFLGIGVFGSLIINLQRRLFSEKRTRLRRLNKKECPHCAFPMEFSDDFCPGCGQKIRISCGKCGKKTFEILGHCAHCGKDPSTESK